MLTYEARHADRRAIQNAVQRGRRMSEIRRDKNATDIPDLKSTYSAVRAAEEWLGGYYILEYTACSWADLTNTSADVRIHQQLRIVAEAELRLRRGRRLG